MKTSHNVLQVEESIKETIHPNAYLKNIRNVHCGLVPRTKILVLLERKNEGTVERKGNRRYVWLVTGLGQKRLG